VTSESDVVNALQVAKEKFGKLTMAANCAGIGVAFKTYNFNKKIPHVLQDFTKVLMVS
jgi:3-hydroxyacyl-CoA dehydrogenase/3-hydroxy-2-methylbutyryl-CoA dehydrogenase